MNWRSILRKVWPSVPIVSALIITGFLLIVFGVSPGEGFDAIFQGAFGNVNKVLNVTAFWVPLALASAGLVLAFTAGLWNIGIEGQIVMGAIAASWLALKFDFPAPWQIIFQLLAAMIAGALWAGVAGVLKTRGKVHENELPDIWSLATTRRWYFSRHGTFSG